MEMNVFYKRISQISEYKGFNSVNKFALDGLNYASSEKINRLKKENASPSIEIIIDITNKFEEINPEWLLTGSGEMLREIATKSEKNIDVDMFLNLKNAFSEIFERLEKLEEKQDNLAIGHTVNSDIEKIVKQKKLLQEK